MALFEEMQFTKVLPEFAVVMQIAFQIFINSVAGRSYILYKALFSRT